MKPIARMLFAAAFLSVTGSAAADNLPNKVALTFKTGYLELVNDEQVIDGANRQFDDSARDPFAIEVETRIASDSNLTIGGEVFRYHNKFKRTSGGEFDDKMRTFGLLAKVKYFFDASANWQPYIGGGVGQVLAYDTHGGPISGDATGLGFQGVVGFQLRAERIGLRLEYMRLHARLDDDNNDEVKTSSQALFVGFTLYFGK